MTNDILSPIAQALQHVSSSRESESDRIRLATVTAVGANGCQLLMDGETTPTQKEYPIITGSAIDTGSRVLLLKISGTWVVIGNVGSEPSPMAPVQISNWNDVNDPGIYYGPSNAANAPGGGGWHGIVLINSGAGQYVTQILTAATATNSRMFMRDSGDDGATWTDWVPISTVSPARPISIPAGANLNNYTAPGWYYQERNADADSGSNYPAPRAGTLEVLSWSSDPTSIIQRYTTYPGYPAVYVRGYYSGNPTHGWGKWQTIGGGEPITSGLSFSMSADFELGDYWVRRLSGFVTIAIQTVYRGAALTVPASGNFADKIIGDMPPGFELANIPGSWNIDVYQSGVSQWFGRIQSSARLMFTHGIPGVSLSPGTNIYVNATYPTDTL